MIKNASHISLLPWQMMMSTVFNKNNTQLYYTTRGIAMLFRNCIFQEKTRHGTAVWKTYKMALKGDVTMEETKAIIDEIDNMLIELAGINCRRELEIIRKVAYSLLATSKGR